MRSIRVTPKKVTPRGTARRLRREAALSVFPATMPGFSIYWNGGKPSPASLAAALKAIV